MLPEALQTINRKIETLGSLLDEGSLELIFQESDFDLEDLRDFIHENPAGYSRKSVFKSTHHEMICCTWLPGQFSPIHDHVHSRSFIWIVDGEALEYRYQEKAGFAEGVGSRVLDAGLVFGEVGLIHKLGNQIHGLKTLVTLHVYLPPLATPEGGGFLGGRVFEEFRP